MTSAYLLQHLHLLPESEEVKIIGIYSSRAAALAAIDRLKKQPGFVNFLRLIDPSVEDAVDGFYIDEYVIDEDHWKEGFVTV